MIVLESLRWVLTAAFAGVTAYHLAGYLRPATDQRALDVPHLLMGPAMIVMIWPWGRAVPPTAWLLLFAGATGWFLAQVTWSSGRHRHVSAFSASAMAAMVWMGLTPMPAHAMAGMDMPHALNWVSAGLGAYLVAAALLWLIRGLRLSHLAAIPAAIPAARAMNWGAVCHGVMSAAMGLSLLALAY